MTPTPAPAAIIYVGTQNHEYKLPGVRPKKVDEEDIVRCVLVGNTCTWELYLIGDELGLEGTNLLDFEVLANGDILFVLSSSKMLPGIGLVTPRDVIRLHPTSRNPIKSGVFTFELVGATVGLTTNNENLDALALAPNGHLVISTVGSGTINGVGKVQDEDLVEIDGASGSLYFDGSAVALTSSSEDVAAAAIGVSDSTVNLYLVTKGNFSVESNNKLDGKNRDSLRCTPNDFQPIRQCAFARFLDGKKNGFSKAIDGFSISSAGTMTVDEITTALQDAEISITESDGDNDEPSTTLGDLSYGEAVSQADPEITVDDFIDVVQEIYLPLVAR